VKDGNQDSKFRGVGDGGRTIGAQINAARKSSCQEIVQMTTT